MSHASCSGLLLAAQLASILAIGPLAASCEKRCGESLQCLATERCQVSVCVDAVAGVPCESTTDVCADGFVCSFPDSIREGRCVVGAQDACPDGGRLVNNACLGADVCEEGRVLRAGACIAADGEACDDDGDCGTLSCHVVVDERGVATGFCRDARCLPSFSETPDFCLRDGNCSPGQHHGNGVDGACLPANQCAPGFQLTDGRCVDEDECAAVTCPPGRFCDNIVGRPSPGSCDEIPTTCGDGVLGSPSTAEQCDDGNNETGDGCSPSCRVEANAFCDSVVEGQRSVCVLCPAHEEVTGAVGSRRCTSRCGNGRDDVGEACDDGGTVDGDGCSAACQLEWPFGAGDGGERDLTVAVGETRTLNSFGPFDFRRCTVNGTLVLNAGDRWTILGCRESLTVAGTIVGRAGDDAAAGVDGVLTVSARAPDVQGALTGRSLQHVVTIPLSGARGGDSSTLIPTFTENDIVKPPPNDHTTGGVGAFGNGGGGEGMMFIARTGNVSDAESEPINGRAATRQRSGAGGSDFWGSSTCPQSGRAVPPSGVSGFGARGINATAVRCLPEFCGGGCSNIGQLSSGASGGFRGAPGQALYVASFGVVRITGTVDLRGGVGGDGGDAAPGLDNSFGPGDDHAGGGGGGGAGGCGGAFVVEGAALDASPGAIRVDGGAGGEGGRQVSATLSGQAGESGAQGAAGVSIFHAR